MEIISQNKERRSAGIRLLTVFLFFVVTVGVAKSQAIPDSLHVLDEVVVSAARRNRPQIAADGGVIIDASMADGAPRVFGEADLLRVMLGSGGVGVISDYSSGVTIDGMGYAQNAYLLNGVIVQFPYHFGGIFSTFNSYHYPRLRLWKSIHPVGLADCLGGIVSTESLTAIIPARVSANVNVGMLASSVSLRVPVGNRFCIEASGRISYIDALYKNILDSDDTGVSYGFRDFDISAIYLTGASGKLRVFGHLNTDGLDYSDDNYLMDTRLKWSNYVAGAEWTCDNAEVTLGYSGISNRLEMTMPQFEICVPSGIEQCTVKGNYALEAGPVEIKTGAEADYFAADLQSATYSGFGRNRDAGAGHKANAALSKMWGEASLSMTDRFSFDAGVELNGYYGPDGYNRFNIDPRLTATFRSGMLSLSAHVGRYHQYIHQVGFSEIGMSSNFRTVPTRSCPPQEAIAFVVTGSLLVPEPGIKVALDAYYKRVLNVPEYYGGVLDLLDYDYVADAYIDNCSGFNTGAGVTVSRDFHDFSASASYNYVVARNRMPGSDVYFTASSGIAHAVSVNASYRFPGNHWSVSAAFVYSSGRPVTPVTAVYFIGERLMVEYGKRNSGRLPDYHRLDIGANYKFLTGRLAHTVSLSLINAYGHRNVEISTYVFNTATGNIRQRQLSSLYRFIPSLSYSISF